MAVKKARAATQTKPPKTPADALRAALAAAQKTEASRDDVKTEIEKLYAETKEKANALRAAHDKKIDQARDEVIAAVVNYLGDKTPKKVGERFAIVMSAESGFNELVLTQLGNGVELSLHEHPNAVLL